MRLRSNIDDDQMDVDTSLAHKVKNKEKKRLTMHKLPLTCICINSDSTYAFTASKDGSIIKWCLKVRKMLKKVDSIRSKEAEADKDLHQRHHVKHINAIAISSDDKFLATGGSDKQIRIWSPSDLTWLHTFTLHRQEVTALVFRLGHPTLYSGSQDRSVMIWNLEDDDNRCFVEALYGHESPITSIDSSRKERVLTSGGLDQSIRVWKIVEQAQNVYQSKHKSADIARLVDDKTFVSGGEDGSITVWTTMKRSPLLTVLKAHGSEDGPLKEKADDPFSSNLSFWITSLATYPISKNLEPKRSRKKRKLDDDHNSRNNLNSDASDNEEDVASDGDTVEAEDGAIALVASGSCDSKLRLWNLSKSQGKYQLKLTKAYDCPGFINDIKFSFDGSKIFAACGQEHRLGRWWRLSKSKNCMRVFEINDEL